MVPGSIRRISALVLLALLAALAPTARPALAATYTVNSTADTADANTADGVCDAGGGVCTLRAAIAQANAAAGPHTINFNISTGDSGYNSTLGTWKIRVGATTSATLPIISSSGVTIDGTSQSGGRASGMKIELDGSALTFGERALLEMTSSGNTIKGLVVNRLISGVFSTGGIGIFIDGASANSNTITGNWIGLDADGVTAAGNSFVGVYVINGDSNVIRGNTIAGNGNPTLTTGADVVIGLFSDNSGADPANGNIVAGNQIGINAAGTAKPTGGSPLDGILVAFRVTNTIIGGATAADRNIISGHNASGGSLGNRSAIRVQGNGNSGTVIQGNYIGTDVSGTAAIANTNGVTVRNATGPVRISSNIISGNGGNGVNLEANISSVTGVTVQDNIIGLSASGAGLGNTLSGVALLRSGSNDLGVDTTTVRGNTISANGNHGVVVGSASENPARYTGNVIAGNFIGTAAGGGSTSAALTNALSGIVIFSGTTNTIGGSLAADRNIVAGRALQSAIRLSSANSSGNTIAGNYIGLAADGTTTLLSSTVERPAFGILLESGSSNNTVGPGNVVSSNDTGIQLNTGSGNSIRGNIVGFASNGSTARGNTQFGIWVLNTSGNTIGGNTAGDGNIVGNHGRSGIFVDGTSATNSFINNTSRNNIQDGILLNAAGATGALIDRNSLTNNGRDGLRITDATGVRISRTTTSANTGNGITLQGAANAGRAAPTLNATLGSGPGGVPTISGTASGCSSPGCLVEIFSSTTRDDGEGPRYLTSGTADPSTGAFSFDVTGCDRFLTATARDPVTNNTSAFSTPMVDTTTGCSSATPTLSVGTPASSAGTPQIVVANTQKFYQHTLTNTGGQAGTFALTASSSTQGWATAVGPTSVFLTSNQSVTVFITVTVPLNAIGGQVETTSVTATSGALSDTKSDYSRVTQTFGVQIAPPRSTLFTIDPINPVDVNFTHTITNTGNGTDTMTLSATNATIAGSPTFSFPSGNQCTLAPGANCTRTVRATLPIGSAGGTFTVTATSSGGPTSSVTDTAFTQSVIPSLTTFARRDAFPSDTVSFVHTLTNIGSQSGTFTPTLTPPNPLDGWSYSFTPNTSFILNPGETQQITVIATVPGIATTGAISGTIKSATLQVTASSSALATADDSVRVLLQPQFNFSAASISPVSAVPLATVVFTHTLQNTSNGDDRYTLIITPTAGLQNVTVSPALPISVARAGSAQVVIRAQVKPGTLVGPESLTVTAQTLSLPRPVPQTQTDLVNVTGAAVPSLAVSPGTRTTNPGVGVTFTYTLTNTGNQPGDFSVPTFTLPNAQVGWSATIQGGTPACLTNLAANATCVFTVDVALPTNAFAGTNMVLATISSLTTPSAPSATATALVVVNSVPSLQFTPDRAGTTNPGTLITYSHLLTNTGNITDTFTFTVAVPSGWTAPPPATLTGVPPGANRTVIVNVTPPAIITAGSVGGVTVTARSSSAPNPTAAVIDTTTIAAVDGATLTPSNQTTSGVAGNTIFFFPTLRNIGSTTIGFDLSLTTAGWTSIVTPTVTSVLLPGATLPLTISVQVPPGTPIGVDNLVTLQVKRSGAIPILATGLYTATTRPIGSLLTPAQNAKSALPGATVVYTHTLRNISGIADTFTLRTIATNGWQVTVAPASVFLDPGASKDIQVTLIVPPARPAGEQDYSYVEVQSLATPALNARGTEVTTVLRFAAAQISPEQSVRITPGQTVTFQQNLINDGNALDTFDITASDQRGWPISIVVPAGAQTTLLPGRSFPIEVRVVVPTSVTRGTENLVTIRATSRYDGTAVSVVQRMSYPLLPQVITPTRYIVQLPLIVKP